MLTKIRDGIDAMVRKIEENNRMTEVRKKFFHIFIYKFFHIEKIISSENKLLIIFLFQFGFYSVSTGLLIYACYRKRPLKKFVKASDIPNHFITERIVQRGVVTKIQPTQHSGPILMVTHKPPIGLPFRSNKSLPIKVCKFLVELS